MSLPYTLPATKMDEHLEHPSVVAIIGPRKCGKTRTIGGLWQRYRHLFQRVIVFCSEQSLDYYRSFAPLVTVYSSEKMRKFIQLFTEEANDDKLRTLIVIDSRLLVCEQRINTWILLLEGHCDIWITGQSISEIPLKLRDSIDLVLVGALDTKREVDKIHAACLAYTAITSSDLFAYLSHRKPSDYGFFAMRRRTFHPSYWCERRSVFERGPHDWDYMLIMFPALEEAFGRDIAQMVFHFYSSTKVPLHAIRNWAAWKLLFQQVDSPLSSSSSFSSSSPSSSSFSSSSSPSSSSCSSSSSKSCTIPTFFNKRKRKRVKG